MTNAVASRMPWYSAKKDRDRDAMAAPGTTSLLKVIGRFGFHSLPYGGFFVDALKIRKTLRG